MKINENMSQDIQEMPDLSNKDLNNKISRQGKKNTKDLYKMALVNNAGYNENSNTDQNLSLYNDFTVRQGLHKNRYALRKSLSLNLNRENCSDTDILENEIDHLDNFKKCDNDNRENIENKNSKPKLKKTNSNDSCNYSSCSELWDPNEDEDENESHAAKLEHIQLNNPNQLLSDKYLDQKVD